MNPSKNEHRREPKLIYLLENTPELNSHSSYLKSKSIPFKANRGWFSLFEPPFRRRWTGNVFYGCKSRALAEREGDYCYTHRDLAEIHFAFAEQQRFRDLECNLEFIPHDLSIANKTISQPNFDWLLRKDLRISEYWSAQGTQIKIEHMN